MNIEERILNDNSCSPYVGKRRGYVEIAFKDGAYWGYEEGCKDMINKACEWLMKYFVLDHEGMSPSGYGVFEYMFRKAMEE